MLLSPNPVSLLCALLLCLPLAILFTTTTTPTTTRSSRTITNATDSAAATSTVPISIPSLTTNKTSANQLNSFPPLTQSLKKSTKKRKPTNSSPPPLSSPFPLPKKHYDNDADDDSLFQLASGVNPNPTPITSPKKLAFMFLTTSPLPLAPLWELFLSTTPKNLYNIYIHADPRFNYTSNDSSFHGVFTHRVIPSKPTFRYTPTLISAARRLLAHALLHDPLNYMFALLSPSCIPLHSFKFTYKTLVKSNKSFIEILDYEGGAFDRWAARGLGVMLPEVKFEDFRIGSQFFVLTRKHARNVVSDRKLWSKFKLPCVDIHTCYPEEHYFPTLLSMVDGRGCVHATLTQVDWNGSHNGHPRTYRADEVGPELILTLRKKRPRYGDDRTNGSDSSVWKRRDPFLFARKFSPDSIGPLMEIANDVIFKD